MNTKSILAHSLLFGLTGCGGGGGNPYTPANRVSTDQSVVISGTAATGAAMANAAVTLKCQTKTYSSTSDTSGAYVSNVAKSELPCLVRAATNNLQLHSIAGTTLSDLTVNITPHTELVIAHLLAKNPANAFDANEIPNAATASSTKIDESISIVSLGISDLVRTTGDNPISLKFKIGDDYDKKLDALQASLTTKNIDFTTIRNTFIDPLPPGTDRLTYIKNHITATSAKPEIQEYLSESFKWISSISTSNEYKFGFYRSQIIDGLINITEYQLDEKNNYSRPTYEYFGSNIDRILTSKGDWQQLFYKGAILSNAQIEYSQNQYWLRLNTDSGQFGLGKWKIKIEDTNASGLATSRFFNNHYTKNIDGIFRSGSKTYTMWIEAAEPDYFIGYQEQDNNANTAEDFIKNYSNQIFCGIDTQRYQSSTYYNNTKFGIKFFDKEIAKLIPVDSSNCNQISDNHPLLELGWKITTINNQVAIELSGKKLPPLRISLGQIQGSYDPSETNPALAYWTDKYSFVILINGNGKINVGIKTAPGASINASPGNGPYLNREALNSLLNLVGSPQFSK